MSSDSVHYPYSAIEEQPLLLAPHPCILTHSSSADSTDSIRQRLTDIESNLIQCSSEGGAHSPQPPHSPRSYVQTTPPSIRTTLLVRKKAIHEKHVAELMRVVDDFKRLLHLQGTVTTTSKSATIPSTDLQSDSYDSLSRLYGRPQDEEQRCAEPSRKLSTAVPMQERHVVEFLLILLGGVCLSFNSGFINGVTLSASLHLPSSHVTGTMSHAGIAFADGSSNEFAIDVLLMMCFAAGAAIAGALVSRRSFHLELGSDYFPLLLLETMMLVTACAVEQCIHDSLFYYYLASMASGLQNGITSKYSGSVVRSTHVTGSCTDIGLSFGAFIQGDRKDCWKLYVLLPLVAGFFSGAVLSQVAFRHFGKAAILINVLIIGMTSLFYLVYLKIVAFMNQP